MQAKIDRSWRDAKTHKSAESNRLRFTNNGKMLINNIRIRTTLPIRTLPLERCYVTRSDEIYTGTSKAGLIF